MYRVVSIVLLLLIDSTQSTFIDFGYDYSNVAREPPKPTAAEIMVDITNDLSYRILQQHSITNRNNFAFSPSSLASVLVALYEGTQCGGSTEIYNVLKLPWNRDILRIGYRDIHRRLRTYFFNEENPLTGLSLSKENVTISLQYEDILKFYGYMLGPDMIPSAEEKDTATPTEVLSTTSSTTDSSTVSPIYTITPEITTSTAEQPTTTSTVIMTSTMAPIEETTMQGTTIEATSISTESTTISAESTTISEESTTISTESTTIFAESTTTEMTTITTEETTTEIPSTTTELSAKLISTIDPADVIFPLKRQRQPIPNRRMQREGRAKRQFPITYEDPTFTINVMPIQPPIHSGISDFHFVPIDNNADINTFYQPKAAVINRKEIYHVFYPNAYETVQARYKVYNSILRFAYIPKIRSSVLELELDSKDYDLLIMIPDYDFGLDFLLSTLKLAPTLRVIRQEMKSRWVQAIIPDFKLKGNIFLTNDLQNLGISEVFEPLKADFSPMTNETGIYAKHIEQNINVHLRTRPASQLKRNIGPFTRPIEVSVNHPFLFFIVDKELDVATMAGRVLNPLNVRIQ